MIHSSFTWLLEINLACYASICQLAGIFLQSSTQERPSIKAHLFTMAQLLSFQSSPLLSVKTGVWTGEGSVALRTVALELETDSCQ